ncbi:MAG: extracellular solute-binding protein [Planctomycetota bacterium]|nr:MAG: extracellular solute-binding protein [Planctomycetota bacterium]
MAVNLRVVSESARGRFRNATVIFIKSLVWIRQLATRLAAAIVAAGALGCGTGGSESTVVVYTSVDQRFAEALLARFTAETGIRVRALFDSEAGKTTGFLHRLRRERSRPRCDVWFSSEVFGTIELAREGLLAPYASPAAADIPVEWKDPQRRWTGLAARARVAAFDPRRVDPSVVPRSWRAFAEPGWAARTALANPLFGTTRGHVAAIFAYWGPEAARRFLQDLRVNGAVVADGNAHAVRLVASGAADICWTDTDDVWAAQTRGEDLELVYPALDSGLPTVWIPCSVAIVANGPHPGLARRLTDFLVSAAVERALYESDSRNVPVRSAVRAELGVGGPAPQALDFERVADALPTADAAVREILLD